MQSLTVHPRVCGERAIATATLPTSHGSSPRVRGTAGVRSRHHGRERFIPACAGNGRPPTARTSPRAVHPRVCGERIRPGPLAGAYAGSSPRVRGTGGCLGSGHVNLRFIPACAGNGGANFGPSRPIAVHPRVCGERSRWMFAVSHPGGSSPRVRGTGLRDRERSRRRRFIPACAGNGPPPGCRAWPCPVHPRVCGERIPINRKVRMRGGSSPRVRGTGERGADRQPDHRFIPACAGNGRSGRGRWRRTTVHPRVCGERVSEHFANGVSRGSSPRVRGTEELLGPVAGQRRFIPACAGNGSGPVRRPRWKPVHPRVCGERKGELDIKKIPAGSSPRVRGTEQQHRLDLPGPRFIPACAGNGARSLHSPASPTVHPRVCGERAHLGDLRHGKTGSSPRVRGTARRRRQSCGHSRFIPACAGNGIKSVIFASSITVHPRVCGERGTAFAIRSSASGSSPRVRGTGRAPAETCD